MKSTTSTGRTIIVAIAVAAVIVASVFFFRQARSYLEQPFPGYLTFENEMVGAFAGFEWFGPSEGLRYHDLIIKKAADSNGGVEIQRSGKRMSVNTRPGVFTLKDFLVVFMAPYASGMAYVIFAIIIYFVGRRMRGIIPFIFFNLGIAYYYISGFDFHSSHHASWLFLLNFVLLPASMTHFALVFPEEAPMIKRHRWMLGLSYLLSFLIFIPYVYTFYHMPVLWIHIEGLAVAYAILSYAFWITMLARSAKKAGRETDRIAATYLLFGQVIAFLIPLTAAIAIFVFEKNIPLNLITPITVVLPVASLLGIILGNLKNTQLKLVQTEKMASLGQLVAGVAHEINNPTTFIYSNISMLREYVSYIKGVVRADVPAFKGEMSANEVVGDLEQLVDTVAEGADRIKTIVADLRRFGHSQDDVVTNVDIKAGIESTLHLLHHEISNRIKIHLDVPEDLTIAANPGQINQVWMNLLSNAVSAIEGNGNIWISAVESEEKLSIILSDDGKGISRKVMGNIFDPFFTTKPEGEGTGLGLAITQQIVHRWKGDLVVQSEVGKGTTMKVVFPK
ncbi:MAG: hypothetical protein HN337_05100 [Deltaproteobacteria bacterium]|nr:hypothetical protein [Deltaproteobacteria bacterium]